MKKLKIFAIVTTGVSEGQYWEDFKGTWTVMTNPTKAL